MIKKKYYGQLIQIVPKGKGLQLLEQFHDQAGLYGIDRTKDNIVRQFYREGADNDIKLYCQSCDRSQRLTPLNPTVVTGIIQANKLFEVIGIDFIGPM